MLVRVSHYVYKGHTPLLRNSNCSKLELIINSDWVLIFGYSEMIRVPIGELFLLPCVCVKECMEGCV